MTDPLVYTHPDHEHGRRCYWDLAECRWVCVPDAGPAGPPALGGVDADRMVEGDPPGAEQQ